MWMGPVGTLVWRARGGTSGPRSLEGSQNFVAPSDLSRRPTREMAQVQRECSKKRFIEHISPFNHWVGPTGRAQDGHEGEQSSNKKLGALPTYRKKNVSTAPHTVAQSSRLSLLRTLPC